MFQAFLAQSILHALVAMLVTEGLLRGWRVEEARWRIRLHAIPLLLPLLVPLLILAAPWRLEPAFAEHWALFAGSRWQALVINGTPASGLVLLLACGLGSALFLRDAWPPLRELWRPGRRLVRGPELEPPQELIGVIAAHARRLGLTPPALRLLNSPRPVLLCEGWPPALVVSSGTLQRLDADTLDVALAHELSHVATRDPAIGYGLIILRAILFFNPAVQWAARAIVDDLEWRADQGAIALTGYAPRLADAIDALFRAGAPPQGESGASFEWAFWRLRRAGMARRCERLRRDPYPLPTPLGSLRVALAWATAAVLAWFIV